MLFSGDPINQKQMADPKTLEDYYKMGGDIFIERLTNELKEMEEAADAVMIHIPLVFRGTRGYMLRAVVDNPFNFKYATDELKADFDYALKVVKVSEITYAQLNSSLRNNKAFNSLAASYNKGVIPMIGVEKDKIISTYLEKVKWIVDVSRDRLMPRSEE